MTCPCNKPKKPNCNGLNPKNVIEVSNDCPVLFHQVVRPATLGDDVQTPPEELNYRNVLLTYEANNHSYLYSSDGVPTFISLGDVDTAELETKIAQVAEDLENEASLRELRDTDLQTQIYSNYADIANLSTEVQSLQNQAVQTDTAVSGDASTVTVTKTTGSLNGNKTETAMPLPVASETSAGVMNTATFAAVQENSENIDSILGGAVVIEDLPAEPTDEQLTDAWKEATGKTELINRASIYDETNKKVWYYYENANAWKAIDATPSVSVSVATNETPGIVKGSTENGQIAVEADGSMSLNGYDGLTHDVDNLSGLVAGIDVPDVPTMILGKKDAGLIIDYDSPNTSTTRVAVVQRQWNTQTGALANVRAYFPSATGTKAGVMSSTDKVKLDNLPAITEIGENLELTDEGVLNATGGGSSEIDWPTYVVAGNNTSIFDKITSSNYISLRVLTFDPATGATGNRTVRIDNASESSNGWMSAADKSKLDSLLEIKSLNDSLELDENGQLSVVGGGGSDVNILTAYTASPAAGDAYNAGYVNSRLDGTTFHIGLNALGSGIGHHAKGTGQDSIAIGYYATTQSNSYSVAIGSHSINRRGSEISFGSGNGDGISNESTRYLANVRAGELPTDAVNLQQMQDYVAENAGGSSNLAEYTLSAPNLEQLFYALPTAESIVLRGNVTLLSDAEGGANVALTTLPAANETKAGLMLPAEKTKLASLVAATADEITAAWEAA